MAEKDNKPKTTAKPAAKPAAAKTTATVKPVEKPTATVKPAAKPTATVKPATKPAATAAPKPAAPTAKPAPAPEVKKETAVAAAAPAKPKKAAATAEKPEKQPKEKPAKAERKGGSGKAAIGALSQKNIKFIIMAAVAFVLIIALVIGIVVGTKSCNTSSSDGPGTLDVPETVLTDKPVSKAAQLLSAADPASLPQDTYDYEYTGSTTVGYYAEVKGSYERVKPVEGVQDDGFSKGSYPKYGSTLSLTTDQKNELISLNRKLTANGTWVDVSKKTSGTYDKMDENGYLYKLDGSKPTNGVPEQLYKHAGSVGLYGGNVSDSEPAVVKSFTIRPRSYGGYYSVTGLYAPAGEVIKIQLTDADMKATSGLTIHIGQALYNGQANNIWAQKGVNRMPIILNTMNITESTATYDAETGLWTGYVGSFLGGPIYVRSESSTFSVTISGGVNYAHFILGVTTAEEYAQYQKSSAPYFDLEVWDKGVLHSGPVRKVKNYSYQDLYKAAVLWEKISIVTTSSSNQGVVFLYDPFVAAGAAVAFPGRRSVNCPEGWITGSLNYNAFVTSGSWGNLHEYHHNFQNYGLGSGADGEVTNNGLNLVSYALFTKISSKRGMGSYGSSGLGGGWNNYTSATWTLQRIKNGQITSTNGLAVYATLLHSFGADAYLKARGSSGKNNYLNKWATVTHNDFSYYATLIEKYGGGTYTPSAAVTNAKYPLFVPVASVYQTGGSYTYDGEKKYFNTMRPYVISNQPFNIDLSEYTAPNGQYASGSVVIPDDFEYSVKSVTQPARGKLEVIDNLHLKYTPAEGAKTGSTSGQIVVTLELTVKDKNSKWANYKIEDVDLILEFEISNEATKMTLERTTYTYADNKYTDAVAAFNAGFAGSTSVVKENQYNPVQNVNTDIWFRPDTPKYRNDYPNDPEKYFIHDNQIDVVDGKLYFDDDGIYRVYLRGRDNCALYYSPDGKNYSLGAKITENTPIESGKKSDSFRPSSAETYFDVKFDEGKVYVKSGADENFPANPVYTIKADENNTITNWLYIKEVLIDHKEPNVSFIGVGMRAWTDPQYTQSLRYYRDEACTQLVSDEDYNAMTAEQVAQLYSKPYYLNNKGQEVSEEVVLAAKSEPPTVADINGSQPYVNAYRSSYSFPDNKGFESDYFYVRDYNYNYVGPSKDYSTWDEGVSIVSCNKDPWDNTTKIDNMLVSGQNTFFHSKKGADASTGAMELVLDIGKTISANRITFYGRTTNAATTAGQGLPKNFSLQVSNDGVTYTDAGEYTNGTGAAYSAAVSLNDTYEFRYVKITITSTHSNNSHFILSGITFTRAFSLTGNGGNHISPANESIVFSGNWKVEQGISVFGLLYHGVNGSKVSFEFAGTYVAVLTPTSRDSSFEVYVDGKKVNSMEVAEPSGDYGITYLSEKLSTGKHKVEIRCTGDTWIDSFALY